MQIFVVRVPCRQHDLFVVLSEEELLQWEMYCPLCLQAESRRPPESRSARRRRRRRRRSADRDSSDSY